MELYELSVKDLLAQFESGGASPSEAFESVKGRIEAVECDVNAYLLLDLSGAEQRAKAADEAWQDFRKGGARPKALCGVPYALKDNMCVKGMRTTCASKILENFVPQYDATVAEKLNGSVLLGKANMDEFAMGSSTENSAFGPSRNPWDTGCVPGGSSGGSAALVAAGMGHFALGSDTGGSIRQPAAFCGVVGLKPTYGRVSRYGLVAFGSSLDQIGPFTRTVEDAALVFDAISGHDPKESTSAPMGSADVHAACGRDIKGMRVGLPKEYFAEGLEQNVREQVMKAVKALEARGAEVVEVSLPSSMMGLATYYLVATAEASSNLARFDGVRYGYRDRDAQDIVSVMKKSRSKGFGEEVKRRIMLGTYVLSAGYYDAYYNKALKVRRVLKEEFDAALSKCDAIIGPTSPSVSFRFGEKTADPLSMYMSDIYTITANLVGLPAISVPCGLAGGLPVGLQITTKAFDEATIMSLASAVESDAGVSGMLPVMNGGAR